VIIKNNKKGDDKMPVRVRDLVNKKIPIKRSVASQILDFLKQNKDKAFTSKEIQNKFELNPSQINTRLSVLKSRELVTNLYGYWFYRPQIKRRTINYRKKPVRRGVRVTRTVGNRGRPKAKKK